MPAKKKTTRRKSSKAPSPAQLRARKKFIAMVKARSKASKKPIRRNKTIITKPKKVVVINKLKANPVNWSNSRVRVIGGEYKGMTGTASSIIQKRYTKEPTMIRVQIDGFPKPGGWSGKVVIEDKFLEPLEKNPTKSTRRKYRNGYLDLVIHGHAKKTPAGWSLGGKTFKQGKGIVPASKRGYYLDLGTGTVFSKKARNVAQGFFDGNGVFHPIRSSSDYDAGTAGETGKKPIRTRSKKRKTALKKASQTARLKAETKRRKSTTSRLASRSLSKSAGILKGSGSRRQRNPRYFAYGIDANGREFDLAVHVAQNKTQTMAWVKKNYPGYKKYVVELSEKFDFIGPNGGVKIKRPKRASSSRRQRKNPSGYWTVSALNMDTGRRQHFGYMHSRSAAAAIRSKKADVRYWRDIGISKERLRDWRAVYHGTADPGVRRNPSVKSIRKEFAGTLGKATDAFAPIGTPRNVAKLGKLLLIDTENATIKPTGIVYLCADSKGKLHLCGSKNVPIYSGAAQSFGEVEKVEYETAKPHLYPGEGVIWFTHKMGENGGKRPTLYADGKGGLKFRGGSYKITREGIVD